MSLRKIVERMATVASAATPNGFNALMLAQAIANAVPQAPAANGIDCSVTVFKRRTAKQFFRQALPGLGVYVIGGRTNARRGGPTSSGWRDTTARAIWDYCASGPSTGDNHELLMVQAELAAETILQLIDRMASDQATGVLQAGAPDNSVVITIVPEQLEAVTAPTIRVLVEAPIIQEERTL